MARLLRTIRLGLLETSYFVDKIKSNEYVKESKECKLIVIDTLKFLYDLDLDETNTEPDMSNPIARPRVPHEVLFVIGGWSDGVATSVIETYDIRADRWITSEAIECDSRAYHGVVVMDTQIFILGGFDGIEYFNSVLMFDVTARKWFEKAPMNSKRYTTQVL